MGIAAVIAGVSLVVASTLLITFFVTENETADRASNWFFVVFYAAMGWTVIEVHRIYVEELSFFWVVSIVTIAILVFLLVTALGFALGRLDFTKLAIPITVGFLIVLLWMLLVSIVIVVQGDLPAALGWFGIGVIGFSIVAVGVTMMDREVMTGEKAPGTGINILYGVVLVGLASWLIWLGLAL